MKLQQRATEKYAQMHKRLMVLSSSDRRAGDGALRLLTPEKRRSFSRFFINFGSTNAAFKHCWGGRMEGNWEWGWGDAPAAVGNWEGEENTG